ncbi:MAG TPA: HAD-IC family P-type ATPase, partial [Gaiellaceae bacterium]|nr:HAD-IC family P-type ATPase [Gaiellaceae bacterium]
DGSSPEEILRLAASLDQHSVHVLAEALVHAAEDRGLDLSPPSGTSETPGAGIVGVVEGRRVAVGSGRWLEGLGYRGAGAASRMTDGGASLGQAKVVVGIEGQLAGVIVMADRIRADAHGLADDLRRVGISHVALVSGDRREIAEEVGRLVGADAVYAEQSPEDKLDVVRAIRSQEGLRKVVMVGDGINDAPALALADVGIAMGAQGATVSSETADIVIVVDQVGRVVDALRIGRRSLGIAKQSVVAGLGLSLGAMVAAAFGYLPPVAGALFQELIDVAVILNALRALR